MLARPLGLGWLSTIAHPRDVSLSQWGFQQSSPIHDDPDVAHDLPEISPQLSSKEQREIVMLSGCAQTGASQPTRVPLKIDS
jgi:hypothetical protein